MLRVKRRRFGDGNGFSPLRTFFVWNGLRQFLTLTPWEDQKSGIEHVDSTGGQTNASSILAS
jgi:hypothetical protein